jgi:hypothetical protein
MDHHLYQRSINRLMELLKFLLDLLHLHSHPLAMRLLVLVVCPMDLVAARGTIVRRGMTIIPVGGIIIEVEITGVRGIDIPAVNIMSKSIAPL